MTESIELAVFKDFLTIKKKTPTELVTYESLGHSQNEYTAKCKIQVVSHS